MKRLVLTVVAFAICALTAPAMAQPTPLVPFAPAAASEPQAVRAAIPVQQSARPVAAPPPARAEAPIQERPAPAVPPRVETRATDTVNVRLEVTITYQAGTTAPVKRSATLTVADLGRGSLRAGNQVAVPESQYTPATPKADGGSGTPQPAPAVPMTSFRYRSVGLNVDANRVNVSGDRARVELSIEFSAVDDKANQGGPPTFPTFSQNLVVMLESGKPLLVAQTNDVVDNVARRQSVEVVATILK